MTFEKPSISLDSTVTEIELAILVCQLSEQVIEIRKDATEAGTMLVRALEALRDIGCLEDPRHPCGECWPCSARLGLRPIPLH